MSDHLDNLLADGPLCWTVQEVAKVMRVNRSHVYHLIAAGVIPRLRNTGVSKDGEASDKSSKVLIPAWAVRSWLATGDWRHEAFAPTIPTNGKAPAALTAEAP